MRVLLVGCGAMGGALWKGWLQQSTVETIVIDPHVAANNIDPHMTVGDSTVLATLYDLPPAYQPDIVLFAVKPQIAASTLADYARFCRPNVLFVSVMAGVSVATIKEYIGQGAVIVRAMPNLPALVGQGMTGLYSPDSLDALENQQVTTLFTSVGRVAWVEDENQLNLVTAISGSGPAYFFRLAESMMKAGHSLGLSKEMAEQLAQQTLVGAGALVVMGEASAETLRARVTSPGGTTAAALAIFDADNGLDELVLQAVKAALQRAQELAT